jgi:hypothetical protein
MLYALNQLLLLLLHQKSYNAVFGRQEKEEWCRCALAAVAEGMDMKVETICGR